MNLKDITVLVVDDSPISRSMLTYLLKRFNCKTLEASNGEEALYYLLNDKVDLMCLDWRMPELSGRETLVLGDDIVSRARPEIKQVPVMIYSDAYLNDISLPSCSFFRITSYLSKRMTPYQQLSKVKSTLDHLKDPEPQRQSS